MFCALPSAKGFQHQRMTNGAMNVEIGNPTYKMYEGEPDDDVGELLDADFALDPDKVRSRVCVAQEGPWVCEASLRGGCPLCRGGWGGSGTVWGRMVTATALTALLPVQACTEAVVLGTLGRGSPLGPAVLGRGCLCPLLTCAPLLSAAHQLHQPRLRHAVHGCPQQPQLAGQHGREAGAAVAGRRR